MPSYTHGTLRILLHFQTEFCQIQNGTYSKAKLWARSAVDSVEAVVETLVRKVLSIEGFLSQQGVRDRSNRLPGATSILSLHLDHDRVGEEEEQDCGEKHFQVSSWFSLTSGGGGGGST